MLKRAVNHFFNYLGYAILPKQESEYHYTPDIDQEFRKIYEQCKPYTRCGLPSAFSLYQAVKYVIQEKIPGALVECGVLRGGCSMIAALTAISLNDTKRKIYLYDTFKGMSEPSSLFDHSIDGRRNALQEWKSRQKGTHNEWCYAPLDEVMKRLEGTGYPKNQLVFVEGKVEETLSRTMPDEVAVLRLDTDWYESTAQEMKCLYPRLSTGGVLMLDDYGYWKGSQKAVDEYFETTGKRPLLHRINSSARIGIKI